MLARLLELRRREHVATVELIEALCECQRSGAFADLGHGSVWELMVRRLHYSPAAASRRNTAMRCALRFPVVLGMLREHRTTLSALHTIEKTLAESGEPLELLRRIDGASQREVEAIVAEARPVGMPVERVRRKIVKRGGARRVASSAAEVSPRLDFDATPGSAPAAPAGATRTDIEERVQLTFSLSAADYERFERAKSMLTNKLPKGVTLETMILELLGFYLAKKGSKRTRRTSREVENSRSPKPSETSGHDDTIGSVPSATSGRRSRHIPDPTRDAVFQRDGHRCTFVASDGTRCASTHDLELDHVHPFALGGTHDPENLRVLCAAHNRRRAITTFGSRVPVRNSG